MSHRHCRLWSAAQGDPGPSGWGLAAATPLYHSTSPSTPTHHHHCTIECCKCEQWDRHSTLTHTTAHPPQHPKFLPHRVQWKRPAPLSAPDGAPQTAMVAVAPTLADTFARGGGQLTEHHRSLALQAHGVGLVYVWQ